MVEAIDDEQEVAEHEHPGETEHDDAQDDPYAAFEAELRTLAGKWYVIHSYAGFERKVKQNIENRKVSMALADFIHQIEVPMEDVVEIKNGQRKMVTRVRIPGYVLVRMDLNEDSWSCVRHTPGVTGFVGNAHNPTPLRFQEAFNMLKSLVEVKDLPTQKAVSAKGGIAVARTPIAEIDFDPLQQTASPLIAGKGEHYVVCVRRAARPMQREVYPIPLRERLPVIRVPLRVTDHDVTLDLQKLVNHCYTTGRYWKLDYQRPLYPPPAPGDQAWMSQLTGTATL
jgi:transcription antitermination factor NusG